MTEGIGECQNCGAPYIVGKPHVCDPKIVDALWRDRLDAAEKDAALWKERCESAREQREATAAMFKLVAEDLDTARTYLVRNLCDPGDCPVHRVMRGEAETKLQSMAGCCSPDVAEFLTYNTGRFKR